MKRTKLLLAILLAAFALSSAQPAFAGSSESLAGVTVTKVALVATSNIVQVYLSSGVAAGECNPSVSTTTRVTLLLDSPAAEAMLDLAIAAQVNARVVLVGYDNTSAACTGSSPQLTFLRVDD